MPRKTAAAPPPPQPILSTPADLIREYLDLKTKLDAASKTLAEYSKPFRERQDEIQNKLLALSIEMGVDSFKTEFGTAYKSTTVTPGIENRDDYLQFVLNNWDEGGNAMLQLGAPQVTALKEWQQEHNGLLPPGVKTSAFTKVNIRRS